MNRPLLAFVAALTAYPLYAGESLQRKSYTATRIVAAEPPVIDGVLDDACWNDGDWGTGFLQRKPYEGEAPSQDTRFRIAYDERNLFVAIRAEDSEPDLIEKRITRRDTQEGDRVTIYLDSYFDHRTAFAFTVSSAGVKSDMLISEDGDNEDPNWDAVWHAEVSSDHQGWTAELAIPFSQLRFGDSGQKTWGVQVRRFLHRKEELSGWQLIPNDSPGFVNWFGELHGLDAVQPRRQVELIPYTVAKTERFESEAGNPFATGRQSEVTLGLDGRMGVTSDLTLSFTVNPDFGQVEADPSEVNLTTSETFFEERRPFFVEGRNILDFQVTGGDGGFSRDNLFYSRRIGRTPQYEPELGDDEFDASPHNTSIVGAFKLTGKTRNGVSIGILDSVTDREYAEIDFHGERRREMIEPLTNYFLGRIQKDFDRGNTILGGIFTATNRSLGENDALAWHKAAYTGGFDLTHQWKDRTYYFSAKSIFSNVQGDPETILETQESPVRYFQRPDAEHVSVDPTRTSLSGHGGTVQVGKGGSGRFKFSTGATWRSPGLELNDVGFLRQADEIMQWSWLGYQIYKPFAIFRDLSLGANQWRGWDFSGRNIFDGGNVAGNAQFKNYWGFGAGINREGEVLSSNALRGGPSLREPGGWGNWFNIRSDERKKLRFNFGGWNSWGDEDARRTKNFFAGSTYRPSNSLSISVEPFVERNNQELQYVDTQDFGAEQRYIFGSLDQTTVGITIRLNYSFTPDLSVQYYGQPFVSAGDYTSFKRITDPQADVFDDRFNTYSDAQIRYDAEAEEFHVDETGNGATDYSFSDPNFNFQEFRSNLVIRWEYSPGSTLYVVWSQDRGGEGVPGEFAFRDDLRGLFREHPHNVFLVKFSYRFLR